MKTLAFVLFFINIGFYAWLQGWLLWLPWQPEQYQSKPQTMQLSMDVERLTLLSEHDAPLLETIAPEKMLLVDSTGVLEEQKSKSLAEEAKITEDNHDNSLKEAKAKLILAENAHNEQVAEPESTSSIVPSNLRRMSAISGIIQLPEIEEAEQIEDDSSDVNASDTNAGPNPKPASDPKQATKELLTENIKSESEQENLEYKQPAEETPKTVIAMADSSEPEKNPPSEYAKSIQQAEQTKIVYNQAEADNGQKTSEQQADDFFSRLAQTVRKVGNTFTRVSNDVFNERGTAPPALAVQADSKPIEKKEPKVEKPKPIKVAAVSKPVKPVVKAHKPVAKICYEIGSYATIAQLNKHANWLKSQNKQIKTFIDKKTVDTVDKVRVYIAPNKRVPAAQQRLIAQNIMMRLRHDGISDMHLMTGGALKNSISLGVYDSYANAQRRAKTIKAKSYANVNLKNYYKQQKKYWLIAKMPKTQQIIASKFRKTFKRTRLDVMRHCK
ncbi:MAG: hypothetical protein VSS52_014125 [Thiotrichaceae bacterium]|nr:hypothetical protein [Thiotrichaceae bacterium]